MLLGLDSSWQVFVKPWQDCVGKIEKQVLFYGNLSFYANREIDWITN